MSAAQDIEPWEELYRYWLARHVEGRPPRRADIDPMIDLPHLASNLVVIDFRAEGAEYRLIGSKVVNHFGVDHTGKRVGTSGVDKKQVAAWRRTIDAVAREGRAHLLVSHYPGADKTQTIALLLPLAPDADGVMKILGATFFGGPFPRTGAFKDLSVATLVVDL